MIRFVVPMTFLAAGMFCTTVLASPKAFITHNKANTVTNVYVDDRSGPQPTVPNSTTKVSWSLVLQGCNRHRKEGICPAVIKMDIDSDSPITVGTLYVDLKTGIITPNQLTANGFRVDINAPAEITVSEVN